MHASLGRWCAVLAYCLCCHGSSEVLAREYIVDQGAANAADGNRGTATAPLKTVQRAAELAQPGDIVTVRAGVYRERVSPARGGNRLAPIVYRAAQGEQVFLRGSETVDTPWLAESEHPGVYHTTLDAQLFAGLPRTPFQTLLKKPPQGVPLTLGQVFVNGQPLQQVTTLAALRKLPGRWCVTDAGQRLWVHLRSSDSTTGVTPEGRHPGECGVEVTVRDRIFAPHRRGLGYIHVRGFIMEHCANQFPDRFWISETPQAGALGCRAGHHWLIENNTVRYAQAIGIDCGYEGRHDLEGDQPTPQNTGYHVLRNNVVTHNGCCGIAGMRSLETRIVGNRVTHNNTNRHTAPEVAGIKMHHFIGGHIENNLIRDNWAHGIWVDNIYRQARVTGNAVIGNHGNGIFFELGSGPAWIDFNIVAHTRSWHHPRDPRGDGLYSHDASGLYFVHNLIYDSARFGAFHTKATKRPRAGVSRIILQNNVFVASGQGHVNWPYPGPDATDNRAITNLFSAGTPFLVHPWGGNSGDQLLDDITARLGKRPETWQRYAARLTLPQWQSILGTGALGNVTSDVIQVELVSDEDSMQVRLAWPPADQLPVCQSIIGPAGRVLSRTDPVLPGPLSDNDETALFRWRRRP